MSSSERKLLVAIVILLFASVLYLLLRTSDSPVTEEGTAEVGSPSALRSPASSPDSEKTAVGVEKPNPSSITVAADNGSSPQPTSAAEEKIKENLDNLQLLLDDHEKNEESLELAVSMMKRTKPEKLAALNAFQWIGGPVSIKETISALTDTEEVADRASDVLHNLIQTDLASEEMSMTPEFWQDLFNNLPQDGRDPYLVLLTAYPVEECFPVLLNLMESQDESLRESALEYASTIAEGVELMTREEAEKWFNAYLAKETPQENQDE